MLSTTLDQVEGKPIGQHPLVVRLMKGYYNLDPPDLVTQRPGT